MENSVIIFGAGGMGKAALEIFQSNEVMVYCFLDDDKARYGTEINNIAVMGPTDNDTYLKYIGGKCEAFIASDDNKLKKSLISMLKERRKTSPVNAIHKNAVYAESAEIGYGNFINAGVVIGANAKIGSHCIFNTKTVIEYDTIIGDFVQIGAGSVISAGVTIEEEVFIGSGVTVVSGVRIGKNARIGAGSVVIAEIKEGETVFGNPAKVVG